MPVTLRAALFVSISTFSSFSMLACDPATDGDSQAEPVELCGPTRATVASVIDGDTIVLDSGEKVRYLMVDTPEITSGKHDCYGQEARMYNEDLVLGQEIELRYDVECSDRYGRLLAYVDAPDGEVNKLLIERGFGCVLYLPPNGSELESEFMSLELGARQSKTGLWGACAGAVTCD